MVTMDSKTLAFVEVRQGPSTRAASRRTAAPEDRSPHAQREQSHAKARYRKLDMRSKQEVINLVNSRVNS